MLLLLLLLLLDHGDFTVLHSMCEPNDFRKYF